MTARDTGKTLQVFEYNPGQKIDGNSKYYQFFLGENEEPVEACKEFPIHDRYNFPVPPSGDRKGKEWWMIDGEWVLKVDGQVCRFQGIGKMGQSKDIAWLHCPDQPAIPCLENGLHVNATDSVVQNCGKLEDGFGYQALVVTCDLQDDWVWERRSLWYVTLLHFSCHAVSYSFNISALAVKTISWGGHG